jgi:hypothetical protein
MKSILISLALFASVFAAAPAYAQVDCSVTPCGNGDPSAVVQAWGLNSYQTPSVAAGVVVTDEYGFKDTCPAFYGKFMCADITRTDYYRNSMKAVARDLIAKGYSALQFPAFKGWMDAVR